MEIGSILRGILTVAIVVTVIVTGLVSWLGANKTYKKDYIETPVKIVPEVKLTIVDNKVDTIYIYRKPNTK